MDPPGLAVPSPAGGMGPPGLAGPSPQAPLQQGTALVAVGSPFGALSPSHFAGAVFLGSVANVVLQVRTALLLPCHDAQPVQQSAVIRVFWE